jgi:hypothetical protein
MSVTTRSTAKATAPWHWVTALGIGSVVQGLWSYLFPRGFYDDFPLPGRSWVSTLGPFNEHLTTDVGAGLIGIGVAAVIVARRRSVDGTMAVMAGFVAFGLAHLGFHLGHLTPFSPASAAAQLVSLSLLVILPAAVVTSLRKEAS